MIAALLAGCLGTTEPEPNVEQRTVVINGTNRTFLLFTQDLPPAEKYPVLLLYHGSGGNSLELLNGTGLALLGRNSGMIVASLDAIAGYGGRWATNPADLEVADDVAFTRAVIDDIDSDHAIDRSRIYAVGYSRGGDFVYQLACRAGDLVRGVAAVASTMLYTSREWCDAPHASAFPPGVTTVLGSADPLMPWEGGLSHRMGARETSDYWAARYGCATTPTEHVDGVISGFTVRRFQYSECPGTDLRLFRIEPLGHQWPGGPLPIESNIISWLLSLPARPTP